MCSDGEGAAVLGGGSVDSLFLFIFATTIFRFRQSRISFFLAKYRPII